MVRYVFSGLSFYKSLNCQTCQVSDGSCDSFTIEDGEFIATRNLQVVELLLGRSAYERTHYEPKLSLHYHVEQSEIGSPNPE